MNDYDAAAMRRAIELANIAYANGEVPVGAVITRGSEIISEGYNRRETGRNALFHAEIAAIDGACRTLGGWRLPGCTLYVTLEPCPMCAGAAVNSRLERVVFGAYDTKSGALKSVFDIMQYPQNHTIEVEGGVLSGECSELLARFFADRRR